MDQKDAEEILKVINDKLELSLDLLGDSKQTIGYRPNVHWRCLEKFKLNSSDCEVLEKAFKSLSDHLR
jgi:hypothetical protein